MRRPKLSGLQVSFFRAAEVLALTVGFEQAVALLADALSDRQRASLPDRLAAYCYRQQLAAEAEARRQIASARADERGGNSYARCEHCGCFKSRPSDVCPNGICGDDPVTHNGSPREVDRAVWGA